MKFAVSAHRQIASILGLAKCMRETTNMFQTLSIPSIVSHHIASPLLFLLICSQGILVTLNHAASEFGKL